MARSKGMSNKREKEKQRQKENQEKRNKMAERRANQVKGKPLDDMMAYIDENGNISTTPPDPDKKKVFNAEDIEIGVPKFREVEDPIKEGKVDFFDESKGFGFIVSNRGERIFFHVSKTLEQIREGDWVSYTVEKGLKGLNAVGVAKKAPPAPPAPPVPGSGAPE
ncbi:cold shock domain-containing protein [Puia sp.]|jgi:cold shock CspA family protein|uniref:cold shock domain-containing protein n=1 Tax=Puia sp. TaxID=2045100 RepID=UPI002F3E7C3A